MKSSTPTHIWKEKFTMSRKVLTLVGMIVVLAMLMSACGGGSQPAAAPTQAPAAAQAQPTQAPAAGEKATLKVLVHQNPPMVEFMNAFNEKFQANNPNITVDMSVVNANDLSTVTQTRLTANDVDVVDMFGFANAAQPYMKNVTPPNWQSLIDAGLLMDISDQPFIKNYDEATIKDAGTYNGKVYGINLGRVSYSGIYYNKDLFTANNVKVPTTWDELVAACEAFKKANIPCMTAGGKDGWPIFVGAYGLIGAEYPDQAKLVQGLWDGSIKWNDAKALEMWNKMKVYAQDMMEAGASGIAGDAAPGRFASGAVAMFPGGTWYGPAIEAAQPGFEWGYIPFPGSNNPDDNKHLFGKYDQGWAVADKTPNKDAAMKYLTEFSDPANYQAFANAVGFIPTQPGATLSTQIGKEVAPYLANFLVGYEQYWVAPKGAGQYANPYASYFKPFGTYDDPKELADKVQADLQSGLDANK
jgi:raffinose/stachyose/melibiose transport system substrate-binding protein